MFTPEAESMMQGWRKAIVWLVLLWLPVQGMAAGFMPFACHQHKTGGAAVHHEQHHHDAHAHHVHEQTAADEDPTHVLACDSCNLCQLCGAAALPAAVLKNPSPSNAGVADNLAPRLQSFIPTLPQRPPRAPLV